MNSIRMCIFSTGERFPALVGTDGFPVSLCTRFLCDEVRLHAKSNTLAAYARVIGYLYFWAEQHEPQIDLEAKLRTDCLLTPAEVLSFAQFLRVQRKTKVIALPIGAICPGEDLGILSNNTFNIYWGWVRKFVLWAVNTQAMPVVAEKKKESLKRLFNSELLSGTRTQQRYGLSDEEQVELRRVIDPSCAENPFNTPVRFRNYLIVRTALETGIRRGELLKLRVEDIHTKGSEGPYLHVVRRPDDKWDPRTNEPQVKTREKKIPIYDDLAEMFIEYLSKCRGKRTNHPYLFTDPSSGHPLGLSAINGIFRSIRERVSTLSVKTLHPHRLRHTFEGNFRRMAEKAGWTDARTERVQNAVSGWTDNSKQAEKYTHRQLEQDAFELIKRVQSKGIKIV